MKRRSNPLKQAGLSLIALLVLCFSLKSCSGVGDDFTPSTGSFQPLPERGALHPLPAVATRLAHSRVTKVADADSLTVVGQDGEAYTIRLQGIDAPENRQAYGKYCTDKARRLLSGQRVAVEVYKRDRYQRLVAKVSWQGSDVALRMIQLGCGWHYRAYAAEQSAQDRRAYAQAERIARQQQLGLWRDAQPQAPWDYRRR